MKLKRKKNICLDTTHGRVRLTSENTGVGIQWCFQSLPLDIKSQKGIPDSK